MGRDAGMIIGKSHLVCQDYARAVGNGVEWVFVSDGCSSSPDTDVGARLTVLMAMHASRRGVLLPHDPAMLLTAQSITSQLELHPHSLDATLLAIRSSAKSKGFDFFLSGDGVYGVKKSDGTIKMAEIKYENNQPYYMNYMMTPARKRDFAFNKGKVFYSERDEQGTWKPVGENTWKDKDSFFWPAEPGDIAFVATDGVSSVVKKVVDGTAITTSSVQTETVIDHLLSFKGTNGQFVARRLNFFQKEMALNGWFNYDDLSIGAVSLEVANEDKGTGQDA